MNFRLLFFLLCPLSMVAQSIGIGTTTPSASALLDLSSTGKGILIPRMSTAQRGAISAPAEGLMVYDTDLSAFFCFSSGQWSDLQNASVLSDADGGTMIQVEEAPNENKVRIDLGGYESILIQRNANGDIQIIPTGLDDNLFIGYNTGSVNTGIKNVALGQETLRFNTTGGSNTAIGERSMYFNTIGHSNTSLGKDAMHTNTSGYENCVMGTRAFFSATHGNCNVAVGVRAMENTTNGTFNTAVGYEAMRENTTGVDNTAYGVQALYSNTTAYGNTAIGKLSLLRNTTGRFNTAVGSQALFDNISGESNTAIGVNALMDSNGDFNVAVGSECLFENTGDYNIGIGSQSLYENSGTENIAIGRLALVSVEGSHLVAVGGDAGGTQSSGNNCTFLGHSAEGSVGTFSNATAIGYQCTVTGSNEMRLGNSSIVEVGGYAPWTDVSDGRFKRNVAEHVHGLDFIMKLRPVTYNLEVHKIASFLHEDDSDHSPDEPTNETISARNAKEAIIYSGFIAQEVETAAKETGYDFSGVSLPSNETDVYGLQYSIFVVPLVKAVQEQHVQIQLQQQQITLLQQRVAQLEQSGN